MDLHGAANRDSVLHALRQRVDTMFAAIDADGWRVPMPDPVGLAAGHLIPLPQAPATMVDLVTPADSFRVLEIWGRVRAVGLGWETVRLSSAPHLPLTMIMMDFRDRFGVYLGAVTHKDATDAREATAIPGALISSVRPRTSQVVKNRDAQIVDIDERAAPMLGWEPDQLIGAESARFIHPEDRPRALATWMEMLSKRATQRVRFRHLRSDGTWMWIEVQNVYHHAERAEDIVVVSEISDIADEMAAYAEVEQRERLFRRLAESMPTGLLQIDDGGKVVYANRHLAELLGVADAESLEAQLRTVRPDDRAALRAALDQVRTERTDQRLEVAVQVPGAGPERLCAVNLVALTDREGTPGALACFTDVTDSARLREELRHKATFDALTGCHNRTSVLAALDHALGADPEPPAVIFIDLDKFKPVNDTLGHAAGDELLVHAADTLRGVSRDNDCVGRLGGDEFVLMCRNVAHRGEAMEIAQRVWQALHHQVELTAGTVGLSGSIGVALAAPGITGSDLIAHADLAMYRAKRLGGGRPVCYDPRW